MVQRKVSPRNNRPEQSRLLPDQQMAVEGYPRLSFGDGWGGQGAVYLQEQESFIHG